MISLGNGHDVGKARSGWPNGIVIFRIIPMVTWKKGLFSIIPENKNRTAQDKCPDDRK
jgi:hypothetical protein